MPKKHVGLTWEWSGFVKLILTMVCLGLLPMSAAEVSGSTATQAVLVYQAPTAAACEVAVSESATFEPLVHDVDGTLFPGANLDTLATAGALAAGERILVIGKRVAQQSGGRLMSRALRADTDHYGRITCEGQVETVQFRTAKIAGMVPPDSGFNRDGHGNWGMPDFDWTDRSKPVIDPLTGAAIYRLTDPRDAGFQTNVNFVNYFGGTGWTNPNNVLSGSTGSLARTTNTNAIFLATDTTAATVYGGFSVNEGRPRMSALGVRVFGSGSDPNPENREVAICLSVDSGQSCYTDPIQVTMPQGSGSEVGVFPAQFPTANFTGWSRPIPAEYWTMLGYVRVSGNTVTLTRNRDNEVITFAHPKVTSSWFRPEWAPGTRIYIAGSAPACPQNYCTIASVRNRTSLTINESLTIATDATYKSAALGVRIVKTNAVGNVSFSASARVAAYLAHHAGASDMCSHIAATTSVDRTGNPLGRTITGRLCVINLARDRSGRLYFIGESEPEFRLLSMNAVPSAIAGHATNELPAGPGYLSSSNVLWSTANPNVYYLRAGTNGGSPSVFRLTYSGDYRENSSALWSYSAGGAVSANDPVKWDNIFRGPKDPRAQILANTTYNETRWPSLANLQFGGLVERKLFFYNLLSGQDLPCAVFTFETETGTFENWFDTLENGFGGFKFAGCHSLGTYGNRVFIISHTLAKANPAIRYGGPFVAPVTHVNRNGAPSTATGLPEWTDGSYDSACPADIPQLYKVMGATGNECLTIRLSGEPCSASAEANEKSWTPCPWDASRSWIGKAVGPGDVIQDFEKSINPGNDSDSEHMLVLKRRELGGGAFELIMLRDSATGYACQQNRPRGRSCVASRPQARHTTQWSAFFRPLSNSLLYDPVTGTIDVENDDVTRSHFNIVPLPESRHTFVGNTAGGYGTRVNAERYAFAPVNTLAYRPRFAGTSPTNLTQSYPSSPNPEATSVNALIANDWRHINSPFGSDWEIPGQTMGDTLVYTLQPGTTSVYRISPSVRTLGNYKRERLTAWAGQYVMEEKSGPEVILTDNDSWQYCLAYRAGECSAGSAAGELFAVMPNLETSLNRCQLSQISAPAPCLFSTGSVDTQMIQMRIDRDDPAGLGQRSLGYSFTRPGAQYVYSSVRMFGNSTKVISTTHHHNGWFTGAVLIDPGALPDDSINRTTYLPLQIAGLPEDSVVEFGYTPEFYCTTRQEVCRVSNATLNETQPFQYAHEPLAPTQAATNIVTVPMLSGRVLYYRVVTGGIPGPVSVLAVR